MKTLSNCGDHFQVKETGWHDTQIDNVVRFGERVPLCHLVIYVTYQKNIRHLLG